MRKFIILFSIFIISCSKSNIQAHTIANVADTELCAAADINLQNLNCIPKSQPYTKEGKTFTEFCKKIQRDGVFINPKCLSTIKSCDMQNVCTDTESE